VRGTVSTDDLNSSADNTGSALAKAKAINAQSGLTNVRADALETIVFGDAVVGGTLDNNNNITINGETITDLVIEGADGSNTLVGAINAAYEKTGVLAVLDDLGALTLTADDGRNIEITTSSAAAAAATGLNEGVADTVVTGGAIQLVSNEQIKLELTSVGTDGAIGFGAGLGTSYLSYTPDTYIETVAITSQEEARRTIDIADSALDRLRRHVSKMGAVTNRLDHVLQSVTTEQMAAQQTQSSMLDVDFASEVVELTRQTIAQETQSAVMAQANSSGASALTLLDGLASLGFGATSFGTGAFSSSLGQRAPVFSGLKFFS
jgi:flagellin